MFKYEIEKLTLDTVCFDSKRRYKSNF